MSYSGNTLAFQAKARGSIPLIRLLRYRSVYKSSHFLALAWKAVLYSNLTHFSL